MSKKKTNIRVVSSDEYSAQLPTSEIIKLWSLIPPNYGVTKDELGRIVFYDKRPQIRDCCGIVRRLFKRVKK